MKADEKDAAKTNRVVVYYRDTFFPAKFSDKMHHAE